MNNWSWRNYLTYRIASMYLSGKRSFTLPPSKHRLTTDQVPSMYRPSTAQVQEIILSMGEDYMTMNEIMSNMGLKHRTSFRENYFLPALEDGAIELQYPEQPKHPKQKYRLTEMA